MNFIEDFKKTAIIFGDRHISYEEFIWRSRGYSLDLNIKQGQRVIIFSENRPELLYSFFAVWEKGGTCVNIDFSSSERDLQFFIQDSKPSYILTSKEGYKKLSLVLKTLEGNIQVHCFEELESYYEGKELFIRTPKLDEIVLMLYTSGTTGDPKGVMLSYQNLKTNFNGLEDYDIFTKDDIILDVLPLHHIFPMIGAAIMPLHVGATVVILDELSSTAIKEALQKNKISVLIGIPKLYEILFNGIMEKIEENFLAKLTYYLAKKIKNKNFSQFAFKKVHEVFGGNIKLFVSGGAKIDPEIVIGFKNLGFELIEGYGMTECAPMISFTPPGKIIPGSAGKVLKGCLVKIADDGEIWVKGPNVMKGYFGKQNETNEIIDGDGWLHTGDLGELKNNYLFVTGRKKDIIVLPNGKNINPIEIEMEIMSSTDLIEELGIIEYNKILAAIIYPNFEKIKEFGISNILETLKLKVIDKYNSRVPNYKKILHVKVVNHELPKTRIGKLRRFKLNDLLSELTHDPAEVEEPQYAEYKIIKKYLQKRKNTVLPDYHLELDVGLDSLDMVEFFAFINENFGIEMDEKIFLQNPTVQAISKYVMENKTKSGDKYTKWKTILKEKTNIELPKSGFYLNLIKFLSMPAFKVYFRFKKSGIENIPKTPCIFAGNHQSFLDAVIVNNALPFGIAGKTCYLAKIKHFERGVLKYFSKNSNILIVDINKNLTESLKKTAKILREGKNVVIFPEGIRTRDGSMNEFKKTFAILSKELNIPVVPFAIKGAYNALPFGEKFPKPKKLNIKFFERIDPVGLNTENIVEKTQNKIYDWIKS